MDKAPKKLRDLNVEVGGLHLLAYGTEHQATEVGKHLNALLSEAFTHFLGDVEGDDEEEDGMDYIDIVSRQELGAILVMLLSSLQTNNLARMDRVAAGLMAGRSPDEAAE